MMAALGVCALRPRHERAIALGLGRMRAEGARCSSQVRCSSYVHHRGETNSYFGKALEIISLAREAGLGHNGRTLSLGSPSALRSPGVSPLLGGVHAVHWGALGVLMASPKALSSSRAPDSLTKNTER